MTRSRRDLVLLPFSYWLLSSRLPSRTFQNHRLEVEPKICTCQQAGQGGAFTAKSCGQTSSQNGQTAAENGAPGECGVGDGVIKCARCSYYGIMTAATASRQVFDTGARLEVHSLSRLAKDTSQPCQREREGKADSGDRSTIC